MIGCASSWTGLGPDAWILSCRVKSSGLHPRSGNVVDVSQVFDILMYTDAEGEKYDLRQTPFKARIDLLAKVLVPKDRWLEVVPGVSMSTAGEVQKRLEGAIEARMEGLVIKDAASKYFFNARKRGWYKIKPEYDGLSESLDLIVVGAYFGDSAKRRGGAGTSTDLADNCAQFLLAAKRHNSGPEASVVTVCKVGTGFSMEQLKEMRAKLRPNLKRYDPHRAPSWMGGWRGGPRSKPDAVIDSPANGFVMEVRAAEIVPTEEYEFGHTLRFPRAVKPMREDK
ncbi:lig4, partial [Symbiodinium sp. CCMP2456]